MDESCSMRHLLRPIAVAYLLGLFSSLAAAATNPCCTEPVCAAPSCQLAEPTALLPSCAGNPCASRAVRNRRALSLAAAPIAAAIRFGTDRSISAAPSIMSAPAESIHLHLSKAKKKNGSIRWASAARSVFRCRTTTDGGCGRKSKGCTSRRFTKTPTMSSPRFRQSSTRGTSGAGRCWAICGTTFRSMTSSTFTSAAALATAARKWKSSPPNRAAAKTSRT